MCPAAIVGDRDSGLTTFLGLLYAAQVRYGGAHEDAFRFHCSAESLKAISGVYQSLLGGSFHPKPPGGEGLPSLDFLFGYRRGARGVFDGLFGKKSGEFSVLRFTVLNTNAEELAEYIAGGLVDDEISRILRSTIVVFIVDASKFSVDKESAGFRRLIWYDGFVARLCDAFLQYKTLARANQVSEVAPVFVFTKWDRVKPALLKEAGLPAELPKIEDDQGRAGFGRALLAKFLPKTLLKIEKQEIKGVRFTARAHFFSRLGVEKKEDGSVKIKRQMSSGIGGWEPEYSYEEYVAFIEHMRGIASKYPDSTDLNERA
ncbi:MAG TPA: hypothetical protein VI893_06655 [Thermoplasmata archaeon]|nr:hypothetical protein [Thermoplasmata archaeon]